jgi:CubicO group peptidase (beta-lactamase class C family)
MKTAIFPGLQWEHISPAKAGFDPVKLDAARHWMDDQAGDEPYRIVIVRGGRIAEEWNHNIDRNTKLSSASATKSALSSLLGIAIEEGKLASADSKIADYYPESMDVPEGTGPKDGRYVFAKDHAITFRQLISNTSGYMKPGEEPGKVFNYQTYGMNITGHALAKAHGLYDSGNPEDSPDIPYLYQQRLGNTIGAAWDYNRSNFELHPRARIHIFGYYTSIVSTALDMARLGWLWRQSGRWKDRQLIPEAWLRESTRTAPAILAHCPREQWEYGYGFWVNDQSELWPSLPRDTFAALGAGKQCICVCPGLDLVVVQSPGVFQHHDDNDLGLLGLVVEACS